MTTYTRKHGTEVTISPTADERIAAIRRIVDRGQYAKIDGTMIDLFSASAICTVYDALSDLNKAKFAAMPAGKMAIVALKLLK